METKATLIYSESGEIKKLDFQDRNSALDYLYDNRDMDAFQIVYTHTVGRSSELRFEDCRKWVAEWNRKAVQNKSEDVLREVREHVEVTGTGWGRSGHTMEISFKDDFLKNQNLILTNDDYLNIATNFNAPFGGVVTRHAKGVTVEAYTD